MYEIHVNKYAHEGSGFSVVHSKYDDEQTAIMLARKLLESGLYRFVYVEKDGKEIWSPIDDCV